MTSGTDRHLPSRTRWRSQDIGARGTALGAVMTLALVLAACSSGGSDSSTGASTTAPAGAGANPVSSHTITIKNFAFSPQTITVAAGTAVTVTNDDQVAHTLTAMSGGFSTGDIGPGQSKTITAPNTPGTYSYFCSIHQYMTGHLTVSG
ncbi:MAG TPA: cupredoxin domain-containing protein [Acidimicrobiales bacterium]|nr:cupredoxin domain-containing protein [Acidimicrobiales bacterium]